MRGIVINKDVEEYEHDIWKGFSARQLIFGGLSVGSATALILFAYLVCYVPIRAAVYLGIPVGVVIALIGFMKVDDMTLVEYAREIWRLTFAEPLTWQSEEYDTGIAEYKSRLDAAENKYFKELEEEITEHESHHNAVRAYRYIKRLRRRLNRRGNALPQYHRKKRKTAGGEDE